MALKHHGLPFLSSFQFIHMEHSPETRAGRVPLGRKDSYKSPAAQKRLRETPSAQGNTKGSFPDVLLVAHPSWGKELSSSCRELLTALLCRKLFSSPVLYNKEEQESIQAGPQVPILDPLAPTKCPGHLGLISQHLGPGAAGHSTACGFDRYRQSLR